MGKMPNNLIKFGLWGRLIEDLKLLWALIKDYWKGEYRDVSFRSVIVFFFMIIYILSPIDLLSDFIPVIGQIDDTVILFLCLYLLEKDLHQYKEWRIIKK